MENIGVGLLLHSASYMKCGNDINYKPVCIILIELILIRNIKIVRQHNFLLHKVIT